jgi:hypothetical protein
VLLSRNNMNVRLENTLDIYEKSACYQKLLLLRSAALVADNKSAYEVGCYINEWIYAFRKAVRGRDYDKKPFVSHSNEEYYYSIRSSLTLDTLVSLMEEFDKAVRVTLTRPNEDRHERERAYLIEFIEDLLESVFITCPITKELKDVVRKSVSK